MEDPAGKSKSRVGLPKLDINLAEKSQPAAAVDTSAPVYPLMAPPHFDLENPVKRFFHEQNTTILGRFQITRERVTMFLPMFFALLISCIFPSVSQLEDIWTAEFSPLIPVFTIFLLRRDLRGCLRMGEFMVLGTCVGAAFSFAVSHITHNKWAVWGFFTGFSLLLLLIHSIGPVDFVRLTWPKIALVNTVITILFSTDKLCDVCEFNKRVLRVLTLFLVPPAIFHICNALFASNGGEWHLPRHFNLFLKQSHQHITLMHRRLQHDHYLILTRHAADEAEYEALLAVQATLQTETAEMTKMASETAARLQHIRNLLNTARFGDFSKTEVLDFYAEFTKLITKLHHSLLAMRLAQLNEFPGKLDARFLLRWYEVWTPYIEFVLKRLDDIAKNIHKPHKARAVEPGELADRRATFMQQYYAIVQAYLRNHNGRFPAETSRVNLMVLALDSAVGAVQKMEEINWAVHAKTQSSLFEHRVRIFGSVIALPFRDMFSVAKAVVLFVALCTTTAWKWITCRHTASPCHMLSKASRELVAYAKSDRWRFAIRFTFAISSAAALVIGIRPHVSIDLHPTWLLVTMILVMLETVGGTITRGLNRILGTITAGIVGYTTVSVSYAVDNAIFRAIWLECVSIPLVFFCLYSWTHARGPYTWQVTLLTFFLIAFANETSTHELALRFAGERVLAICEGTVWAAICTALIWPQYAAAQLLGNCYSSVRAFHKAFDRMLRLTVGWSRHEEKAQKKKTRHHSLDMERRPSEPATVVPPLSSIKALQQPAPRSPSTLRDSFKIKIPKPNEAPPAESFKQILQTLERTVAQQVALADDTRLERWSPPARDLPALMLPFFRRTLRILECAALLLRTPLLPELYGYLQPLKQMAQLLHHSVKESQKHMEAALERRDPDDLREFVPPAARSKQFDEVFATLTRSLGVSFHEKFLSEFLRLSALLVLQKELLREWDHVVMSVLLQDRHEVVISTAEGTARRVAQQNSVGFVARQLPALVHKAASRVAEGFGIALTPRGSPREKAAGGVTPRGARAVDDSGMTTPRGGGARSVGSHIVSALTPKGWRGEEVPAKNFGDSAV